MRLSIVSAAAAALVIAAPALAGAATENSSPAAAAPAHPTPKSDGAKSKSQPDFGAIMAVFDKLFPPQPDPDPIRLALARTSVQAMWPDGAYGKMMVGLFGGVFDRVMQLKESDLEPLKLEKASSTASDGSIHDKAVAKDPYFDQRMGAIRAVLGEEAAKASAVIDPRMREGLARAMARRFDAQQLNDINGFFATPSGHAFANQYMQLWIDPDLMRSVAGTIPQVTALMPETMQKIKAADEKYPKPAKAAEGAKSSAAAKPAKNAPSMKSATKAKH